MNNGIGQAGLADKVLAALGKRRAVQFPTITIPAEYYTSRREGFFSSLLRPNNRPLPKGWLYADDKLLDDMKKAGDETEKTVVNYEQ